MFNFLALLLTGFLVVGFIFYKKSLKPQVKAPVQVQAPKRKASGKKVEEETQPKETKEEAAEPSQPQISNKDLKRQENELKKAQKKIKRANPTHSSFLRGFKGFKGKVVDFDVSPDGDYVVACSSDQTFRIFRSTDFNEQEPQTVYQKIDFHQPTAISLKHDKKLVAIGMGEPRMVEFYSIDEKTTYDDGEKTKINISFLKKSEERLHKTNMKHMFLDFEGKFYVTGSDEEDTTIKAWSLNGENLGTFATSQLRNHHVMRSENGRFLAIGAWTSDVMILELKTNKDGSLKSLGKAMALKGHRKGIIDVAFSPSNDKAVTLSKDQTIKVWNIDVRYEMSEDPRCLETINLNEHEELKVLIDATSTRLGLVSLDNNTRDIILMTHLSNIILFDVQKKKVIETIENAHSEGSQIYKLLFKEHKERPYLYTSGDDGRINMWDFGKI